MSTSTCYLAQPTLVLNKSWVAIRTTPVSNALRLLARGAARAITPETYELHGFRSWADLAVAPHEPHVKTVRMRIPVPEVIVLTNYGGMPERRVSFTRRNLFKRDRNTCQYCGARPGTGELTIDHVVPSSRGGASTFENCVLACVPCNRRKSARTPREAGMNLRAVPAPPRWTPTIDVPVGRIRQTWEQFLSERYWNAPLEGD